MSPCSTHMSVVFICHTSQDTVAVAEIISFVHPSVQSLIRLVFYLPHSVPGPGLQTGQIRGVIEEKLGVTEHCAPVRRAPRAGS